MAGGQRRRAMARIARSGYSNKNGIGLQSLACLPLKRFRSTGGILCTDRYLSISCGYTRRGDNWVGEVINLILTKQFRVLTAPRGVDGGGVSLQLRPHFSRFNHNHYRCANTRLNRAYPPLFTIT